MTQSNIEQTNDFLIITDLSYFIYNCIFGAVSIFTKNNEEEAKLWIKPPDEVDQKHLPNLIHSDTFRRILKSHVMRRLETMDYIAKQNFQNEIDAADKIDIIFAMDDRLKNNFRLSLYPTYKGQRRLIKRSYDVYAIKDYVINVIFKELDIENKYGYHMIQVEGAEGDDVIAVTLMNFKDLYRTVLLISSDHDYLQLDGVHQFDMSGKEIKRTLGNEDVTADEFLLGKILMGDKSDNITQVLPKCGPKTALKLVRDKALLKKRLAESQDAINQFKLNKKIISFKEIPQDLVDHIVEKVNICIYDRRTFAEKDECDLKDFMNW